MLRRSRILLALVIVAGVLGAMPTASADPSDNPDDGHGHGENHSGPPELPPSPPAEQGMPLVGNSGKDGTTNSDLAF